MVAKRKCFYTSLHKEQNGKKNLNYVTKLTKVRIIIVFYLCMSICMCVCAHACAYVYVYMLLPDMFTIVLNRISW